MKVQCIPAYQRARLWELLDDLGVMGWFMLVTIPGLVAFVSWLIFLILHRGSLAKASLSRSYSSDSLAAITGLSGYDVTVDRRLLRVERPGTVKI